MSESVAGNLKLLRQRLGWSQEHLAEVAGVSVRTVQRAENGDELSGETLQALAAACDLTVEQLTASIKEEEAKKVFAQVRERYQITSLTAVERSTDILPLMGFHAFQVTSMDGLADEQQEIVAVLEDLIRDYGDIWSDYSASRTVRRSSRDLRRDRSAQEGTLDGRDRRRACALQAHW